MSKRFGRQQKRKLKNQVESANRDRDALLDKVRVTEKFYTNIVEYLRNKLGPNHVLLAPLSEHYEIKSLKVIKKNSFLDSFIPYENIPRMYDIVEYHLDKIFAETKEDNFFSRDIHLSLYDDNGAHYGCAFSRDAIKYAPIDILAKSLAETAAVALQKYKRESL